MPSTSQSSIVASENPLRILYTAVMKSILAILLVSMAMTMAQDVVLPGAFYQGCGNTKTCFGIREAPNDCIDSQDCVLASAYTVNSDGSYNFELLANWPTVDNGTGWVATGFSSNDAQMGDDFIFVCDTVSGNVNVGWNIAESDTVKYPLFIERSQWEDDISLTEGTSVVTNNDAIWCSVTRVPGTLSYTIETNDGVLEPSNTMPGALYFWLVSSGHTTLDGVPMKHAAAAASDLPYDFE